MPIIRQQPEMNTSDTGGQPLLEASYLDDEWSYGRVSDLINSLLPITLLCVGLWGNLASFVVYSRRKFETSSTGFYFRAMAVTDTLTLLDYPQIYKHSLGFDLIVQSSGTCKLAFYGSYAIPAISSWILAIVSLDRMLSIRFGHRLGEFLRRRGFQRNLLLAVVSFNLLLYLSTLFYFDVSFSSNQDALNSSDLANQTLVTFFPTCFTTDASYLNALGWLDLVNSTLLPFVIMSFSTFYICRMLVQVKNRFSFSFNLYSPPSSLVLPKKGNLVYGSAERANRVPKTVKFRLDSSGSEFFSERKLIKNRQFAATAVTLNLVFLLLNINITVVNIVLVYVDNALIDLLFTVSLVLFKANFVMPVFVYLMTSGRFRAEFKSVWHSFSRHLIYKDEKTVED